MSSTRSSRESYGFGGRLTSEFPSQIIVDATEVCNLACVHCPHPEFKKSPHYKARYLELDLHQKMVEEVQRFGAGSTQYIRYTSNGEPLVHPRIYDMLEHSVVHAGVFVTLTTNGTIMNEKRIGKLLASGLHMIDISIDALNDDTYAKVRINGDLRITRKNVLRLIEIKREVQARTRIVVSFVEQQHNLGEARDFERYWKQQGADAVVIRRLHSAAGGVQQIKFDLLQKNQSASRYPCLYPWERISLNPRGQLAFCPQDWVHGSVLADYRTTSIREVWQGESYRKLRDAHLKGEFSSHAFCGQCPDWAQTRWPGEGRSYADLVEEFIAQDTE